MSNPSSTKKLVIFLDSIGRNILAEYNPDKTTVEVLAVKNPVILHIQTDHTQRMSVQLLPILFREFLADKDGDADFFYLRNNITETDPDTLVIDFRLMAQYSQLFGKSNLFVPPEQQAPAQEPAKENSPKIVNLFDE